MRSELKPLLQRWGLKPRVADVATKISRVIVITITTILTWMMDWQDQGVRIVGTVPHGFLPFTLPLWDCGLWQLLLVPALLISAVGFVESISVGQTLAAKRDQRIEPNQELVALGVSNLSAAFTGGFPVTGGFARSVVNFDAGAQTPAAGLFTAVGITLVSLFLTSTLYYLPLTTMAATIVVAVLPIVNFSIMHKMWNYAKSDFVTLVITFATTLIVGMETGLIVGIGISLIFHIYRTSRPHIVEVGLVAGTEYFRNVKCHTVVVSPKLVSLRLDESLYFGNARVVEDHINNVVTNRPWLDHVVLQCSAINDIDASALESLETIDFRLQKAGLQLHLSEVKGPVMDRLKKTNFLKGLSGKIFLTHYQAIVELSPEVT